MIRQGFTSFTEAAVGLGKTKRVQKGENKRRDGKLPRCGVSHNGFRRRGSLHRILFRLWLRFERSQSDTCFFDGRLVPVDSYRSRVILLVFLLSDLAIFHDR